MKIPNLRNARIGTKVSAAMFLAVGGLFSVYVAVTGAANQHQAQAEAVENVTGRSALLRTTVEVLDKSLRDQVQTYAKVFKGGLTGDFLLNNDVKVDVAGKQVPALMLMDKQINLDFTIPDTFTSLTGAYATIFVRDGDEFVRVTTSHKKEDGNRAIGTSLDRAHPAYDLLMRGEAYAGAASLFGGQYMTHYEPIFDASKKIIGVLYVGINFTDSMKVLGDGIKSIKLGENGGFYVLSTRKGKDLGKAIVHRQVEGENLFEKQDVEGNKYIQTMLNSKDGVIHYSDAVQGKPTREHVASFTHIKDWQLLLVGDAYLDEITAAATKQRNEAALMGLFMVILMTGLLNYIVRRLVAKPFANALEAVQKVGGGDLTGKVTVTTGDESGRLLESLQSMTTRLSSVVEEVRQGTDAISSISAEVAEGNLELSSRTEQQASALEQTASSMEQMNASVKNNAENALNAQRLAREASGNANQGGEVVSQVVAKMDAIKESAKRIADITSVVDGIAFQTNILALNAAVEAARAGEQGRGFAVVATEVRNLAQRSSAAAKEIKELINESLEQVASGSEMAESAKSTMQNVVDSIERTSTTIDEISTATQEQSVGISEINSAIVQLDQVTQKNAALVEEAAAAAQTMKSQSEHLAHVVEFFKVDQEPGKMSELAKKIVKSVPRLK